MKKKLSFLIFILVFILTGNAQILKLSKSNIQFPTSYLGEDFTVAETFTLTSDASNTSPYTINMKLNGQTEFFYVEGGGVVNPGGTIQFTVHSEVPTSVGTHIANLTFYNESNDTINGITFMRTVYPRPSTPNVSFKSNIESFELSWQHSGQYVDYYK
jgi:hypothetical protein